MAIEPTKKLGRFLDVALKLDKSKVAASEEIQRLKEEAIKAPKVPPRPAQG